MSTSLQHVRITAVLACHNRRDTTLRCLASLEAAVPSGVHLSVVLFDDGSSDGTGNAVREAHPDVVVVEGDGKQFWCGGMRAAMRVADQHPYDFLLWLNDDVELKHEFMALLLDSHQQAVETDPEHSHVIIGALAGEDGKVTYSGLRRRSRLHPAKLYQVMPAGEQLARCDTMNGNCVLLPSDLVHRVGEIDPAYVQQIGDVDYGYRCALSGAKLWVAPRVVGSCKSNTRWRRWSNPRLTLSERIRVLNSPHGMPFRPWLHFMRKFGGAPAIGLLFASYGKSLVDSLLQVHR